MKQTTPFLSISLLLLTFFAMSCKTAKDANSEKKRNNCLTYGTVKDYTNVEDCGYLIETEDGKILFPQGIKATTAGYRLDPNQNICFDYTLINNVTNLCVVEGKTAEFTCLTLLAPRPSDCLDADAPTAEWMIQLINILRPNAIYKHLKEKEIHYLFDCVAEKALYDCKGVLKCQHFKTEEKICKEMPTAAGKLIYKAD